MPFDSDMFRTANYYSSDDLGSRWQEPNREPVKLLWLDSDSEVDNNKLQDIHLAQRLSAEECADSHPQIVCYSLALSSAGMLGSIRC